MLKSKKILLFEPEYVLQDFAHWLPLGKAVLAGFMRKYQYRLEIIDNALLHLSDEELIKRIKDFNPDIIGTGGISFQMPDTKRLAKLVKKHFPDIFLLGGGTHLTYKPEDGLDLFDLLIMGEGEITLLEVCNRFLETSSIKGETYSDIPGLCYRSKNGKIFYTQERELIQNLDEIPFPAYDLLDLYAYGDPGNKTTNIISSRGCPFLCIFCTAHIDSKQYIRYHSVDYILALMKLLSDTYDINNFHFMDNIFNLDSERTIEFCKRIIAEKRNYIMDCFSHVKQGDKEVYSMMKKAGFTQVFYGIESGNDNVLLNIKKGVTSSEGIATIKAVKEGGLLPMLLFMLGNAGETEATIMDTINFAKKYNPPFEDGKRVGFNIFHLVLAYPGSHFFIDADKYGVIEFPNRKNVPYPVASKEPYSLETLNDIATIFGEKEFPDNTDSPLSFPAFVPNGLTSKRLVELQNMAIKEAGE